jgi:hypothetical protein
MPSRAGCHSIRWSWVLPGPIHTQPVFLVVYEKTEGVRVRKELKRKAKKQKERKMMLDCTEEKDL